MVRFLDGPAEGVELALSRAPMFLRVVVDETTLKWDALDQLDDTPGPSERVHVYRRDGGTGETFACTRGHGCAHSVDASYRHLPNVDGEQLRDMGRWREWAQAPEAAALRE